LQDTEGAECGSIGSWKATSMAQ